MSVVRLPKMMPRPERLALHQPDPAASPAQPVSAGAMSSLAKDAVEEVVTRAMHEPETHGVLMMSGGNRSPTLSDVAVGREIRERRRAIGMTQKAMARQVGVTGAQFHRYETGMTRIAASRLIAIAQALGVRAESLMTARPPADARPVPVQYNTNDEMAELIEVFSAIVDPRHRSAVVAVARMMTQPGGQDSKA